MTSLWVGLAVIAAGLLLLIGYAGGRHRIEGAQPLGLFIFIAILGVIWTLCDVFYAAFNGGY